ncbi:hypothetical protein ACTI_50350 [Actinoplanes sp. OR16]|uniref:phosphorylase family protein n=1 Tax=Actinoplanes sp. OR16 TaxID=946334 RepID=UPI000F6DE102|nr:hypothetical protein [Actinoplanes sp. OR16]BBH68350.1 hypothetical protein ACTI_50350 [Actinoplanes sp. OR16]
MEPTIGIITALPIECFAVMAVLDQVETARSPEAGDGASYWTGTVPSAAPGRPHRVVLSLLPEDGGVAAAHGCANLHRSWRVGQVLMCGIACGVPRLDVPAWHVRLGDILVAEEGIVPYGHVRATPGGVEELRRPGPKPSVDLKNAARRLRVAAESGVRAWEPILLSRAGRSGEDYARPPASTDVLLDDDGEVLRHPPHHRTGHVHGQPKVHYGRIGSGGRLINSAAERDRLARAHRLIGFDMEGDGVADAAYLQQVPWFMVRGVSDYGSGKNDTWHRYASLAAAAYTRALLAQLDPRPEPAGTEAAPRQRAAAAPAPGGAEAGHRAVVEAVWQVRTMRHQTGRDDVVTALTELTGVRIVRARDGYRDIDGMVRQLGGIAGGLDALVQVLWNLERDSVPLLHLARLIGQPLRGDDDPVR